MLIQRIQTVAALRRKTLATCLAAALAVGSAAAVVTAQPALAGNGAASTWSPLFATMATAPVASRSSARLNQRNAPTASAPLAQRSGPHRDGSRRTLAASSTPTRPAAVIAVANCNDNGPGSLREAATNAVSGDVIDLQLLTCSTITLLSGAVVIMADDVSLLGPGRDTLTLDGNHADNVLFSYGMSVTDLTVTNGSMHYGGCINAYGNLTLTRTTVTGCQAGDGTNLIAKGGGAFVYGDLAMTESTISHSTALAADGAAGGGASVYGHAYLTDSTISNNSAQGDVNGALGGGLMVNGTLYVDNSRITDNAVRSSDDVAYGGGVSAVYGVTITKSTISGNTAHSDTRWSYGGGIHSEGPVAMTGSTLSNNTASSECASCYIIGGGALAFGATQVVNSTVSGNTVQLLGASTGYAFGGGLAITGSDAYAIALYNSTVSGNAAIGASGTGMGGGVHSNYGPFGLFNSTVASNFASTRGGGAAGGDEGGLAPMLSSAIVAMNQAPADADLASFTGPLTVDGDHSLVMSADSDMTLPADTLSSDPKLLPLTNNGGPTATHALAACSPAIDTGIMTPWQELDFDQRGDPFVRDYGSAVDIGAFELQPDADADADRIFYNGFEVSPCP